MPTIDADKDKLLAKGLDYLGTPTEIGFTGTSDLAAGSTGIPAPSTPGGMAGFGGGAGGMTARGGQTLGGADLARKVLGVLGERAGDQPGGGSDVSLSDRLRSGPSVSSLPGVPTGSLAQPDTYGSAIGAEGGAQGLRGMGTVSPITPDLSMTNIYGQSPGAGAELANTFYNIGMTPEAANYFSDLAQSYSGYDQSFGALQGAAGTPTSGLDASGVAGGVAGLATGPLLSALSQLATSDASPEVRAAVQGLIQAISPAAGAAASGAASGIAAGTGALSGAAGGLAAAAPGLIASAPAAAMIIATSINNMLTKSAMAESLGKRAKTLGGGISDAFASLSQAPGLLQQLGPDTTPEQAAAIYKQVEDIQRGFEQSGMEDFLQHGYTQVMGPAGMGSMIAGFPGGPAMFQQLSPYMQAMDLARMRATDIAARGGQPIEGARPLADYALNIGDKAWQEAIRPGSSTPGLGQLNRVLGELGLIADPAYNPALSARPYGEGPTDWHSQVADPSVLQFAGLPAQPERAPYTQQDVQNYAAARGLSDAEALTQLGGYGRGYTTIADVLRFLGPAGAGAGITPHAGGPESQYAMSGPYGLVTRDLYNQLQAIQPGQYETGLANLMQQRGFTPPAGYSQYGFGTGALPVSQLASQIGAVLGGTPGAGVGLAEGLLPEEERKRAGM